MTMHVMQYSNFWNHARRHTAVKCERRLKKLVHIDVRDEIELQIENNLVDVWRTFGSQNFPGSNPHVDVLLMELINR